MIKLISVNWSVNMEPETEIQIGISSEALERHRETMGKLDRWVEEQRRATPECPDESRDRGAYDENASKWFGGSFVYKTESGKYFAFTGNEYKLVNPIHLQSYLRTVDQKKHTPR